MLQFSSLLYAVLYSFSDGFILFSIMDTPKKMLNLVVSSLKYHQKKSMN